jgi:hypothetical protein
MNRQSGFTPSTTRFFRVARALPALLAAFALTPTAVTCQETTSPIKTIYIVAHPHLDIGYTNPPQVVEEEYKARIDEEIAFAREHPDYKWNIEETWQFRQWQTRSSTQQVDELVRMIRDGRFGLGGGHSTLHSTKAGIEELNRYLYDARRLRSEFGVPIQTVYHNDSPGLPWSYPQVLAKCGIRYLVVGMNLFIGGGFEAPYHPYLFRWEGPDGSQIMTWVTWTGYYETTGHYGFKRNGTAIDGARLEGALRDIVKSGYPYDALMIQCSEDNNVNPNLHRKLYETIQQWNREGRAPRLVMARPEEFFSHILAGHPRIPVKKGSWDSPWDVLQMIEPQSEKIAKNAQDQLLSTEKAWSLAAALGSDDYPGEAMDNAWDHMLVIDEHSGGDGISKHGGATQQEVDAAGSYFEHVATDLADTLRARTSSGLNALFSRLDLKEPGILVFNPLSWTRTDVVRVPLPDGVHTGSIEVIDPRTSSPVRSQMVDIDGDPMIAFTAEDVPSLGIRRYAFRPAKDRTSGAGDAAQPNDPRLLENQYFRVRVAADGAVESLFDKKADTELVSPSPTPFGSMTRRTNGEFFNSVPGRRVDADGTLQVSVGTTGPVCRSVIIRRPGNSLAETEIILYDGLRRVDLIETVDRDRMDTATLADNALVYSMVFPLNLAGPTCRVDTPAGWLNPGSDIMKGAVGGPRLNVQHGVTLSTGRYVLAFLSPDVHTMEVPSPQTQTGSTTHTTLVSAFYRKIDETELKDKAMGQSKAERGFPARWQIRYSLVPRDGAFDPVADARTGWQACTPLLGRFASRNQGTLPIRTEVSFLSVDSPQVILYGLKLAEFGEGLILKSMETAGKPVTATLRTGPLSISGATQTTIDEQDLGGKRAMAKGRLSLTYSPHELKTLRLHTAKGADGHGGTAVRKTREQVSQPSR